MDSHLDKKVGIEEKAMPTKSSSRKHPYHHGDLRAALLQAALVLIEEHGVKGLALSDAARLAGVSVAAPYRHFKDKETLLAEIAAEGFVMFRDALAQAYNSNPKTRSSAWWRWASPMSTSRWNTGPTSR